MPCIWRGGHAAAGTLGRAAALRLQEVFVRELFVMDSRNYNPGGSVEKRPSVRGIIVRDGRIAMMRSRKYDYFKLPGGGIEPGETPHDTLVREVREESGLIVRPETIKEFGYARRIERGTRADIFVQDNYYFLCEAEMGRTAQNLDDYEAEERFVLQFVSADAAISTNERPEHSGQEGDAFFCGMLARENRVLRLLKAELGL